MPTSNPTQSTFLGGEISPWAMGRVDLPTYRQSMKLCLNGYPVEEGAWTRRTGFIDCGYTHRGYPGIIRSFVGGDIVTTGVNTVYLLEFTSNASTSTYLRIWTPSVTGYPALMMDAAVGTITSFSAASPTLMTMGSAQTWNTGDTIIITMNSGSALNGAMVAQRQLIVTKASTTTFTLKDAITGANIDGATIVYATTTAVAQRIVVEAMPYTSLAEVQKVRVVQSGTAAFFLSKLTPPWFFEIDPTTTPVSVVYSNDAFFYQVDGPYLDPEVGLSATGNRAASATTADAGLTYTVVVAASTSYSAGHVFSSTTDINRVIRMWVQPALYAAGTYAAGDTVTYNQSFWTSIANSNTAVPGQPLAVAGVQTFPWVLTPNVARWSHGSITSVTNATTIVVTMGPEMGANPLSRTVVDIWQIGKYSTGIQPAVGGFLDGRVFFGGALVNNVDISGLPVYMGNHAGTGYHLFAPTDIYGGVFDDASPNETFNDKDNNQILWFSPDRQGMLFATENGQWLVGAATSGEALTPTTLTIRKVDRFKSAFIEPSRVGTALIFVQASGRKIYEYMVDAFSNRFTGRLLNPNSQHLPEQHGGVIDLTYQEDPLPAVWAACADGTLLGCTYRRFSDFATVPPEFYGWHQHVHGGGRLFQSLTITTAVVGQDCLAALTYDAIQNAHHVEVMSRQWGPAA